MEVANIQTLFKLLSFKAMAYFTKAKKRGVFHPQYVASDVLAIDYEYLAKQGISVIAFDVDGTLTVNGSSHIDIVRAAKLTRLLDSAGIQKRYLASNSIRNLDDIAKALPGFIAHQPHAHNGKPSKIFYQKLINKSGEEPKNIAMVGDRAIQDILGPKRMGIVTVLVELDPALCNFKDKVILRHLWQRHLVRRKA